MRAVAVLNITFHIVGRRRRRLFPPINKIIFNTRSHAPLPPVGKGAGHAGRASVPMDFSSGTPPALPGRRGRGERFDRLPKKKKPGQARKSLFFLRKNLLPRPRSLRSAKGAAMRTDACAGVPLSRGLPAVASCPLLAAGEARPLVRPRSSGRSLAGVSVSLVLRQGAAVRRAVLTEDNGIQPRRTDESYPVHFPLFLHKGRRKPLFRQEAATPIRKKKNPERLRRAVFFLPDFLPESRLSPDGCLEKREKMCSAGAVRACRVCAPSCPVGTLDEPFRSLA